MFQRTFSRICAAIICIFVLGATAAPWIAPCDPYAIDLAERLAPPSAAHPLGRDAHGADILSRLLYGGRVSFSVSILVVAVSGSIGVALGVLSGFYGGAVDLLLMRLVDVLLAFPGLLLAIALVAVLGPGTWNVVLALSLLGWVSFARLARGQTLALKEREFILAARISGQRDWRIMWVHVLPNILSPVIVQATFGVAGVIIAEASLSFLGLGAPPGAPSWGMMLSEGKEVLLEAPHVSIFPGLAIMLVVLSINFLGDRLRDRFDPRMGTP
jgi:peptide/nickel transport system permease protein